MAKEYGPLKLSQAGLTDLGIVIFKRPGLQWNFTTGVYEAVDVVTAWTDKVAALTDAGSGWYYGDIATGDPTDPQAEVFVIQKQGVSFAADDPVIASGPLPYNLLDVADGVEAGMTLRQSMRAMTAAMAGIVLGAGSATVKFRDQADTKNRITATVDGNGNRSSIVLDLT